MAVSMNSNSLFSDFRITLVRKDSLRALASCKVGEVICLSGMRVVEGSKGKFLAMPSRKDAKGDYQDIFFPVSKQVREQLQASILNKYEEMLAEAPAPAQ